MGAKIGGIILIVLGAGILFLIGRTIISDLAFKKNAITATGTVTDQKLTGTNTSAAYSPVVQFTAKSGEQITFTDASGQNPAKYDIGQQVTVYYQPQNPKDAMLNDNSQPVLWAILGILAVFFIGMGIFLLTGTIGLNGRGYISPDGSIQIEK